MLENLFLGCIVLNTPLNKIVFFLLLYQKKIINQPNAMNTSKNLEILCLELMKTQKFSKEKIMRIKKLADQ